jgi:hypothetical protein
MQLVPGEFIVTLPKEDYKMRQDLRNEQMAFWSMFLVGVMKVSFWVWLEGLTKLS